MTCYRCCLRRSGLQLPLQSEILQSEDLQEAMLPFLHEEACGGISASHTAFGCCVFWHSWEDPEDHMLRMARGAGKSTIFWEQESAIVPACKR